MLSVARNRERVLTFVIDGDGAEGRRRWSERAGEGMRLRAMDGNEARGNETERRSERE